MQMPTLATAPTAPPPAPPLLDPAVESLAVAAVARVAPTSATVHAGIDTTTRAFAIVHEDATGTIVATQNVPIPADMSTATEVEAFLAMVTATATALLAVPPSSFTPPILCAGFKTCMATMKKAGDVCAACLAEMKSLVG